MITLGADWFEIAVNIIKMLVIFVMMIQAVPLLVWVERRGSAYIQNRFGPNRVGPLGLMQLFADAVKFLTKEDMAPKKGVKLMFYFAPVMALVPAALALASIPLSVPINIKEFMLFGQALGPYRFVFQGFEIGV